MLIRSELKNRKMSVYRLAKISEVPYATVNDIVNGKARLEKCSAETVYKIANALDLSMEDILAPCFIKRGSFENFKSTVCHRLKELGDKDFIIDILTSKEIRKYYNREWYPECLYLLAMLDYISRENDIPICIEYDDIRKCRLEETIYPSGVHAIAAAGNPKALYTAAANSIPEFKRFNIIENDVRNVI